MFQSGRLILCFSDLAYIQKTWTLEDIAVFEKMLLLCRKSRRGMFEVCKKSLMLELRMGRRALDKSLDKLACSGLVRKYDATTYTMGEVEIILRHYYIDQDREALRYKLNYYIEKPNGKFNIVK
jgi:hypothetical protein